VISLERRPVSIALWRAVPAVAVMVVFMLTCASLAGAGPSATPGVSTCPIRHATPFAGEATATPAMGTPAPNASVTDDVDAFSAALRACGLDVREMGDVEQPFLRPESGMVLRLTGGNLAGSADLQVFMYLSDDAVTADASVIGTDGNPPTMMIHWIGTPHFFRTERLIVLYVGDDQAVIDLLTALLGPSFAGPEANALPTRASNS
jgi:hypothetical protein